MIKKYININSKSFAFSLIEILMSILIVSLIFVAMAPVFTKRILPQKNNGVVYTFKGNTNLTYPNSCLIAGVDFEDGNFDETYSASQNCSEYKFTVPNDVTRINLTLVAGGGGGGGAAGGFEQETTISTGSSETAYTSNINPDIVKEVKLSYLSASGKDGDEAYVKGNTSNDFCESISSGVKSTYCGGKGGDSSPAIYDFQIPKEYIKGLNFVNNLSTASPVAGSYTVSNEGNNAKFEISWGDFDQNKTLSYGINNKASGYEIFCSLANVNYLSDNAAFSNICQIPTNSIMESYKGTYGTFASNGDNTNVNVNTIYKGGLGGKNLLSMGYYGAGGQGQGFQITRCPQGSSYGQSCEINEANDTKLDVDNDDGTINEIRKGKIGNAAAIIKTERPGGTGGGGAAGTVVRIINMSVVPNATYTIVVGSGGQGGQAGSSSIAPTNGKNGTGGTTSAIYDENGSLIYMVNGGTGGEGGKIWNSASGAYSGENGQSGRNYQMLITANANLLTTIAMDEDYLSSLATIQTNPDFKDENGGDISNLVARRLTYRKLQEEPYLELNKRKNENEDFTNNVANKSGGFSGFDKTNVELSNNQYDGLYYRGLIDNQGAYIGGLGGFSGLANKAGCGGYFMGNFDGRQNAQGTLPNDETTRKNNINTFSYNNVSYNVSDFYENCSTNSPNGQSAEFIPPIPNSSNLGSAGSGGGGGGYNIQRGSGNGGDGQDGYVMIEWRK